MRPIGLASSSLGPAGSPIQGAEGLELAGSHCLCVAGSQMSLVSVSQWKVLQGSGVFSGVDVCVLL